MICFLEGKLIIGRDWYSLLFYSWPRLAVVAIYGVFYVKPNMFQHDLTGFNMTWQQVVMAIHPILWMS